MGTSTWLQMMRDMIIAMKLYRFSRYTESLLVFTLERHKHTRNHGR